ncbi:conserved hypothetical Ustilaginaceae-specific protein [Sporisorium reilianum SRZ2]|uniref:Conserved hypothetical Ustilaginaceae-specific protein n=1 Tax=Sporisorium reilianum (strain SRZ2) TaxID=999809 RepID=E6ZZZ0_SPORE|nr:conserved hypothetical Ustilaginaceae-specific protein [Sporisorium reilianum SRZ2]
MVGFRCFAAFFGIVLTMTAAPSTAMRQWERPEEEHPRPDVPKHQYFPQYDYDQIRPNPAHDPGLPRLSYLPHPPEGFLSHEAGSSAGSSHTQTTTSAAGRPPTLPAFPDTEGGWWGPYELGHLSFQPVEYPLRMPHLIHLYGDDGRTAVNIKDELYNGRFYHPKIRPMDFRPDPNTLTRISEVLKNGMASAQIRLAKVPGMPTDLEEGTFLLPPLVQTNAGLEMAPYALQTSLPDALGHRIRSPSKRKANLFLIEVPMGIGQTPKQVLVALVPSDKFITVKSISRPLWLFFERRGETVTVGRYSTERGLTFLGATFMPYSAEDVLSRSEVLTKYH